MKNIWMRVKIFEVDLKKRWKHMALRVQSSLFTLGWGFLFFVILIILIKIIASIRVSKLMTCLKLPSSLLNSNTGTDSWILWGAWWIICVARKCCRNADNSETKVIKWWSQQLHELFIFLEPIYPPSVAFYTALLWPPHLSKPTAVQVLLKLWFSFSSCHFLRSVCNKGDRLLGRRTEKWSNEKGETFTGKEEKKRKKPRNPSVFCDLMLEEAQKLTMINNINMGCCRQSPSSRLTTRRWESHKWQSKLLRNISPLKVFCSLVVCQYWYQ